MLRNWCIGLCAGGIFCSIIQLLSPTKRTERVMRFACVLLFCLCFCLPLIGAQLPEIDFNMPELTDSAAGYSYGELNGGVEFLIMKKLKTIGVDAKSVTVNVESENPKAVVEINGSQSAAFVLIENCIKENFGLETQIILSD
ncbi:MAG TPA: hypothetical protein PK629_02510 [Oscillospiraceae bacterium]|nr:hypothetical protein [Oscillospiraceae bacterium]HPF55630.1 hypothetical protein [Clostridiales bacterium]HPK34197.1 hypothetical protein [Oscillospiraceae bacterium]HPR74900.1 hypothetical protein [Oscillospiraceae bacterium]